MSKHVDDKQLIERIYCEEIEQEDFPLVDVPESLHQKLYHIPRQHGKQTVRPRWLKMAGVAASVVMFCALSFSLNESYQEYQLHQQAQQEVKLALFYLNKANEKAAHSIHKELKEQLQNSTIDPVINTVVDVTSG
ncbi:hypothetical protein QWI17_03000 [Gilvimarinus sp. SDUM040013]|uniref:Anti-sigma factor n=1 Tax=Gilvimarinus gilvus TaxID=3058038 RepID=A0ABU4S1H0_9GAMM|nr:hypothetical protein [Gilvimarinus sp. SDUM040013]MDO3384802.1 hypothetical protein [Gilvimarinus sp. SDUM040013]MDX6850865.1 hypothetical protein [Gilvimarinus sp. SDUM040013]